MPQSNDTVNLSTFFDEWGRCISSTHQRDSFYRHGYFDSCSDQYQDLKLAMRAKVLSDPKEAEKLIATSFYRRNLGSDLMNSPTRGVIWEVKDNPGWDAE